MAQLPLVLAYHSPLLSHLLGVETAIYFHFGVLSLPDAMAAMSLPCKNIFAAQCIDRRPSPYGRRGEW